MKFKKSMLYLLKFYSQYIKSFIKRFISWPYILCKALYNHIKLYTEYSDNWERYAKFREIQENSEKCELEEQKRICLAYMHASIFSYFIILSQYCSCHNNKDSVVELNSICENFKIVKCELKKHFTQLEEDFGLKVPDELKNIIEKTQIDDFRNLAELSEFSKRVHSLINDIA